MPAPLDFRGLGERIFRLGDSSPVIREFKAALTRDELYQGKVDDVYSDDLLPVVFAFQRMLNLRADGVIGPQTLGALGIFPCRYIF